MPIHHHRRKRGVSAHGVDFADLAHAFVRAERELGVRWKLKGRGHVRRVTIRAQYARHVNHVARSWRSVNPAGSGNRRRLYPLAIVERAATLVGVEPEVIIRQEFR
jgi:hypothetical protein